MFLVLFVKCNVNTQTKICLCIDMNIHICNNIYEVYKVKKGGEIFGKT